MAEICSKRREEVCVGRKRVLMYRGRVGKAHTVGEHSMFKSPDHFSGRVGFVGSGQGLRKQDSVRGKHSFEKWQGDVEDT